MIRMGRSSKSEDLGNDSVTSVGQTGENAFPFSETRNASGMSMSENEAMALDIKEGRLSGFVGAGTVLTGDTSFQSMMRVDGQLSGRVSSESGTLVVGSTGRVDANIDVYNAIVNGVVNGDITAADRLELGSSARIVGNVKVARLIMADGAILEGSCTMVQARETFDTMSEEQRRLLSTNELSSPDEEIVDSIEINSGSLVEPAEDEESAEAASN